MKNGQILKSERGEANSYMVAIAQAYPGVGSAFRSNSTPANACRIAASLWQGAETKYFSSSR